MLDEVCKSDSREFIIGTEIGILHRLQKDCPKKRCYPLDGAAVCRDMKKTTLPMVRDALVTLGPHITVPEDIASRARLAIERMLALP